MRKALSKEEISAIIAKKRDWFNLEQDIFNAWCVVENLDNFIRRFMESEPPMTMDEIWNHVYGIREVANTDFEELWRSFEEACKKRAPE